MKGTGRTTCNTARVWKHGPTAHAIKAGMCMGRNKESEATDGMMARNIQGSGTRTKSMVLESILGSMAGSTRESG